MTQVGAAFLAFFVCIANPASAKILFVCGATPSSEADYARDPERRFFEPTRISMTPDSLSEMGQIALLEDEGGYDIRLGYGGNDERSLRDQGAEIFGTGLGTRFVHLLVSTDEGASTEHFIFSEDHDGLGNLVWGQSPEAGAVQPQASDKLENEARCVLP